MNNSGPAISQASITTLVTVTYADRIDYLHELLRRAFDIEKIARAIVVSNASVSDLGSLDEKWGSRLKIIYLEENSGSANGYAVGIEAALLDAAQFVWLMDDDNAPKVGALGALHHRLAHHADNTAVLGFRPTHQADIARGIGPQHAYPPRSSFLGFHYRQIAFKLWRRIRTAKVAPTPASFVSLPYAPYGGLLLPRALLERIGLPMRELVLYADDTEYTRRITASGGIIELVTGAEIEDLENSWYLQKEQSNNFLRLLQGGSDFRAYYGSRNHAWFDKNIWLSSKAEYALNRAIYIVILRCFALLSRRHDRYRLLMDAIRDGHSGQLNMSDRFPL